MVDEISVYNLVTIPGTFARERQGNVDDSAPRGRGAAHGAVPRGRVTTGDGGGHDDAGMRRAQNHKSRSAGRRSRRRRHRPTHTLPSTRASRETTWQQE